MRKAKLHAQMLLPQNDLIRAAGAVPPVLGSNGRITEMSLEQWKRFNPQVVYGCGPGFAEIAARLLDWPGWKDADAVRNGRILKKVNLFFREPLDQICQEP